MFERELYTKKNHGVKISVRASFGCDRLTKQIKRNVLVAIELLKIKIS